MHTSPLRFEPLTPADLPAWRAMLHAYLREHDSLSMPDEYWDDEFFAVCLAGAAAGTHLIILAKIDDAPIGFALARLQQHWYRSSVRMGSVDEFYVAPGHRRAGIGRALAARIIEAMRAAGATTITASVLQAKLDALLFWQRMGFSIEAYYLFLQA